MSDQTEKLTKLQDIICANIEKLVTLETVTIVGGIKKDSNGQWGYAANPDDAEVGMLTKRRLIDGDITTVIHPRLLDGDLAVLRDFHAQREAAGDEIVERNIAAVKALFHLVIDLIKEQKPEPAREVANPNEQ